jgi:hypothetical protein
MACGSILIVATAIQELGLRGEAAVRKHVACPRCRRERHLVSLPRNFQCADLICKFCGFLAQVKATTTTGGDRIPSRILGGAGGRNTNRSSPASSSRSLLQVSRRLAASTPSTTYPLTCCRACQRSSSREPRFEPLPAGRGGRGSSTTSPSSPQQGFQGSIPAMANT